MPRPTKGPRLGGSPSHQRKILSNLAVVLIREEKVVTTIAKAKALRPLTEKLITRARKDDVHARRMVLCKMNDREALAKLFEEVAPRYLERAGGYTRLTRMGPRRGDGAEMAMVELV